MSLTLLAACQTAFAPDPRTPETGVPASPAAFTVDDVPAIASRANFSDPEFNDALHQMVYWDYSGGRLGVSVADLDPVTGLVRSSAGPDAVIATDVSPSFKNGQWWSHNGPEWGRDASGWSVFFTKDDADGTRQIWRATRRGGVWESQRLTTMRGGQAGVLASRNADDPAARLLFYIDLDTPSRTNVVWATAAAPNAFAPLPSWQGSYSIARHVDGTSLIAYAPRYDGTPQVTLLDTRTVTSRRITADPGDKFDTFGFHAPEYGGELLVATNIDRQVIAIYRDTRRDGGPWTRIAELRVPQAAGFPYLYSVEPVSAHTGVSGRTWFTFNATRVPQGNRGETGRSANDGSIWVAALGRNDAERVVRRIDDGAATAIGTTRYEPEAMLGATEVFVYYERFDPTLQRFELRRARSGITYTTPPR